MHYILQIYRSIFSHSDHSRGPVSETDALSVASDVVKSLTSRDAGRVFGKLCQARASLLAKKPVIYRKNSGYYVVSVLNKNEQ